MSVKTTATGWVTRAPEVRATSNGQEVISFGINAETRKNKDANWINVSVWKDSNEHLFKIINEHVKKGSQIQVIGDHSVSTYINKSNETTINQTISAFSFDFIGGSKSEDKNKLNNPAPKNQPNPINKHNEFDDDIPF